MKLWEVLKALEEDTDKKFKSGEAEIEINFSNCFTFKETDTRFLVNIARDWQEVKQPVTWQEALEAWAVEGKTIRCKDDECDWLFLGHRSVLKDTAGPIDRFQINGGTWYIEN